MVGLIVSVQNAHDVRQEYEIAEVNGSKDTFQYITDLIRLAQRKIVTLGGASFLTARLQ